MLTRLLDYLFAALFGTFQRMIFWELFRVFVLCLFALAGVFTLLAVLQQLQFGVSLSQALKMLPMLVPTSVPWITPPACLFASCVVYGRMANDNEAVALKAAGVDLLSVLRPALLLGVVACLFTAYLQFDVTPQSWRGSREVLLEDPEESIGLVLKRKPTLEFPNGDSQIKLSVRDVQVGTRTERVTDETGKTVEREVPEHRLVDVVLKQRKVSARSWQNPDVVARMHSAVLRVNTTTHKVRLDPERMESWSPGKEGTPHGTGSHVVRDDDLVFDLPTQFDLTALRKENAYNPAMVDWLKLPGTAAEVAGIADSHRNIVRRLTELHEVVSPLEEERDRATAEAVRPFDLKIAALRPDTPERAVAEAEKAQTLAGVAGPFNKRIADEVREFQQTVNVRPAAEPAARLKQISDHGDQVNHFARIDRTMRYEYYLRPAIAFGCLLFAVLGCPVGLWANRADYLSIFVICFLPALLVYYPILFMVGGYARDGKIPMGLGVWTANGVLALGAAILSWRLIRR